VIFRELTLHDFGVFGGRVSIDLKPKDASRPVILFGGLNGRGKTTILDAIQVVLFGQRATISNRGSLSWDDYLRATIHRSGATGASITLEFNVADEEGDHIYRINRSWEARKKGISESFDVAVDGKPDKLLSDHWDEHIETILPARIAALNFFDGEKIESLADPLKAGDVIGAAIDSLLGVGLLNKLSSDLKIFLKRSGNSDETPIDHPEVVEIEITLGKADEEISKLQKEYEYRCAQMSVVVAQLAEVEAKAVAMGSEQWGKRSAIEAEKSTLIESSREFEDALLLIASGVEPLKLVKELIDQTLDQAKWDADVIKQRQVLEVIEERDLRIFELLNPDKQGDVETFLRDDVANRKLKASGDILFDAPDLIIPLLQDLSSEVNSRSDVRNNLNQLNDFERQIVELDRVLQTVPSDSEIIPLIEAKALKRGELNQLESESLQFENRLSELHGSSDRLKAKRERLLEEEATSRIKDLDQRRAREFAQKAIETVSELASRTLSQNISLIEVAILEKLAILLGKERLVQDLRIDPATLQILISTSEQLDLPVERLSAGERQLLAIATLWGLSSVSGHPLPLVIDTPLGRLDSEHRRRIVTHYFPNASNQVLILSTDEEIDHVLLDLLKDSISHQYIMEYDDEKSTTDIRPGYFAEVSNAR